MGPQSHWDHKQWDHNGITLGSQWDRNGIALGSQWDHTETHNGIAMGSHCITMGSQWDHTVITMGSQWDHTGITTTNGTTLRLTMGSQWDHTAGGGPPWALAGNPCIPQRSNKKQSGWRKRAATLHYVRIPLFVWCSAMFVRCTNSKDTRTRQCGAIKNYHCANLTLLQLTCGAAGCLGAAGCHWLDKGVISLTEI